MDILRNKTIVQRFDQLAESRDASGLDELCTPDMVNHSLLPSRPRGLEGTREFLTSPERAAFGRWTQSVVVAENDLVVQFGVRELDWRGQSFRGFATPSGHCTNDAAFMYRLVDGRIAERWAIRDDLAMLLQLGAITAHAETPRATRP